MPDNADEAWKLIENMESVQINLIRTKLELPGRGACEDCGELIPQARRLKMPSAVTCVTCQEIREHQKKTGHRNG